VKGEGGGGGEKGDGRVFLLKASSQRQKTEWMVRLREACGQ
jgi:hypothetical protein